MGQKWSKFMSGHMEANNSDPPVPEASSSPDSSGQQSQASTEASSSTVPIYQGGPFSVAAADVELSSLKDAGSDQERGKETQTTPTPTLSTSQELSPLKAFPKGTEKVHFKKSSQASPSTAWKCGPIKGLDRKSGALKRPRISSPLATVTRLQHQHHTTKQDAELGRKFGAQQELSTSSPSQFSRSQVPGEEADLHLAQMEDDVDEETASQSMLPEAEDDVKVDSTKGEDFVPPPHSSAQKMLFFELDRKRKAPTGLPSLAVECMGSSRMKLKARTALTKPRSNSGRKRNDLGEGKAVVGRRVRKAIGKRGISEGHVYSYDVSSRLYQIEYDNGKEEAMEWLKLQPCLIDQSKTSTAPVEEVKGTKPVRKSLRNAAAKVKRAEEFVYTKRSVRGRRRKK